MKITKKMQKGVFASNIIKRRRQKEWTQEDLAHKIGVHVNTIKAIELGNSEGQPQTRKAIAEAFKCDVWDLMKPPDSLSLTLSKDPRDRLRFLVEQLPDSLIDVLIGIVEGLIARNQSKNRDVG